MLENSIKLIHHYMEVGKLGVFKLTVDRLPFTIKTSIFCLILKENHLIFKDSMYPKTLSSAITRPIKNHQPSVKSQFNLSQFFSSLKKHHQVKSMKKRNR